MPRPPRILSTAASSAAPPPEPVPVESDFIIILAALLCALICVGGLITVARCAFLRRSSTIASAKGLNKKSLKSLPKSNYDSAVHSGLGDCAICLAEFSAGDEIRVLPHCSHTFHVECIDTWLVSHSSCPSCRQVLRVATCRKCGEISGESVSPVPTSSSSLLPF